MPKRGMVWVGQEYGRLVVVEKRGRFLNSRMWLCRCACGVEKEVSGSQLLRGGSISCGCYRKEVSGRLHRTHGQSSTSTFRVWAGMLDRCRRKENKSYKYYGALGVSVCSRWESFAMFFADMGERPPGMTLDRIDPSGDYCPENCRWASAKEQNRNQRRTKMLTFNGETKALASWAEELGIKQRTLRARINVYGWSVEKALAG